MDKLNIATLNINGMKSYTKQSDLLQLMKTHLFDIVFLQETHVDSISLANAIKSRFDCDAYWSLGHNRSSGVGILLSPNLKTKIQKFDTDLDGRCLSIDLLINENPYRLINIYAPNNEKDRKQFFNDLSKYLVCNRNLILGGDFNCILNPKYDKIGKGANSQAGCIGSKELSSLCNDYNITDIFRHLNPHMFATTWHSPISKDIHTRLDRFYVSKSLISKNVSFDFYPIFFSDHDVFSFKIENHSTTEFGPSYWKFNDSMLEDSEFVKNFTSFYLYHTQNLEIDLEKWDNLKEKIRNFCILYSKKKSKEKFNEIRNLRQKYSNLVQCEKNYPGQYFEQIENLRLEIKRLEEKNNFGSKIRAKVEVLENEENPSYFFNKVEQRKAKSKTISIIESNNVKYDKSKDILNCFRSYYEKLYTAEPVDNTIIEIFLKNLPCLSHDDSSSLETHFDLKEFKTSLLQMQDNKSPGPDGLTKAFYVKFFDIIGEHLVQLSKVIFDKELLSDSQRLSYITLLCKNQNDSSNMKNWRPISLLNYDYKIISKSLSNRLNTVLETLVHEDQTCAVKGRSIFDNVHLLRNIIDYVDQKNLPCIFLNLDQEKAFDRVSYDFMFKCLKTFGFGNNFIKWIKILYTDISSSVLVNQFISDPIKILRGIRQGCALSLSLYVLCLEPFANQVRLDPEIHGLSLPGTLETVKAVFYADDGTGILTNLYSVQKLLEKCKLYGRASGAKLNVSKTRAMYLGKWKSRSDHPFGISWVDSTKLLGNTLGNFLSDDDVWSKTLGKIQNTLNNFKTRHLSFKGKSYIINSLALSKLWYLGSTNLMSTHYIKQFNHVVFNFFWNKKSEPLSRETLYLHYKQGGQNLVNISMKLDCLLLKHIQHLINGSTAKWCYFAVYWIGLYLRKYDLSFSSLKVPHSDTIPAFYKRCLDILRKFENISANVKLGNLSCKQLYSVFSNTYTYHPRIESVHPKVDFISTWRSLQDKFIDPFSRDIVWRSIHEILPVQQLLCKYKISKISKCHFCNYSLESFDHLFVSCPVVTLLYDIVLEWIAATADIECIPKSSSLILYHTLPTQVKVDKYQNSLIQYFLSECKYAIWMCRNLKKFESRKINSNFIVIFLLQRVKLRILADFQRMPLSTFTKYWVEPGNFCIVNDENKLEIFI